MSKNVQTWKTPYNRLNHGSYYEINTSPSETLPDQSMSVSEIFRRYAMGLPLGGQREGIYNEDNESLMNYERMDKIEKIEVQRRYQQRLREIDEDLKAQDKKRYQEERDKLINEEVEKRISTLKTPQAPGGAEDGGRIKRGPEGAL